jgi:hypothetical protein
MARLTVEHLEGRDLMAAGVTAGGGLAPEGLRTAVVAESEALAEAHFTVVSPRDTNSGLANGRLTAPLGSTKGSVTGVQDSAAVALDFTPPIGSNKGSILTWDPNRNTGCTVA